MREGFAFDNEKPGFTAEVAPFRIARTPVSNGEFLAFVEDGGYATPSLWSFQGRAWLEKEGATHPLYWRRAPSGAWQTRWFDRRLDLDPRAPVIHVNYWEAEAYAHWALRRLPTEFEWEAAARGPSGRLYPWGDAMDALRVDMDARLLGRGPVGAFPKGASEGGCLQMLGTAWEWTSNPFLPYDGFAVDMYPFMSTLQFGDHRTTRGGSCATSSCLIRNTYRQAYLPDRRDAFTGIRTCAR
jgi:iron(II)-dependent oxidoreductase